MKGKQITVCFHKISHEYEKVVDKTIDWLINVYNSSCLMGHVRLVLNIVTLRLIPGNFLEVLVDFAFVLVCVCWPAHRIDRRVLCLHLEAVLNSLGAIGRHDGQQKNKLPWRLVTSAIFVRC